MVDMQSQSFEAPFLDPPGTSEFAWRQSPALQDLEELSIDGHELAIVVAPHPDDETLALGGAISAMTARGMAVIVVTASDGEASHPNSTTVASDEMRALRRAESRSALRVLAENHPGNVLNVQLHLRDGRLAAFQEELTDHLLKYLTAKDLCFATWEFDGHPDHEAVGRAARIASEHSGARLLQYPVWTWHWAAPDEPSIPWDRARRIALSDDDQQRKESAIQMYKTQIFPLGDGEGDEAIVAPPVLLHFQRPFEVVFE